MTIDNKAQQLTDETLITLYELSHPSDATRVYRFTPTTKEDDSMPFEWDGNTYFPLSVVASGFDKSNDRGFTRPSIRISNVDENHVFNLFVLDNTNLENWTFKRIRTYASLLSTPDERYSDDIYNVNRITAMNDRFIEFELIVPIDQDLAIGRQKIKQCVRPYRVWDSVASAFVYSTASNACPHRNEDRLFTKENEDISVVMSDTDPQKADKRSRDVCNKSIEACEKRFPKADFPNGIPTHGFPSNTNVLRQR